MRIPSTGGGTERTVYVDPRRPAAANVFPAKEWSITDDVMNVSDAACLTIANNDGQNAGKFKRGQLVELDEADDDVADGAFVRCMTGRIVKIESYSDLSGSNIMLTVMDLGWHLTKSHGQPLKSLRHATFGHMLDLLIDKTWGIGPVVASNDLNRKLKHGRAVIPQQVLGQKFTAVLPKIQVEPGQSPFEIFRLYAARDGFLINIGARGELIVFRPRYDTQPLYSVQYHPSGSPLARLNNVEGRPLLVEDIEGLYSEVQCWSTAVVPPKLNNRTEDPNEQYTHSTIRTSPNPLSFERRKVFFDSEAIDPTLRQRHALWNQEMDEFNSWEYTVELKGHSQGGAFFVSDTMCNVEDEVNGVSGTYYVQSVRRSQAEQGGSRSQLTLRRPGLLNPELGQIGIGGGAKNPAARPKGTP